MVKKTILFLIIITFFATAVSACSPPADNNNNGSQTGRNDIDKPTSEDEVVTKVSIADFGFDPQVVEVPARSRVVWTNNGASEHQVEADDETFNGPIMKHGDKYDFVVAGNSITYHCRLHPDMKGTITVKEE